MRLAALAVEASQRLELDLRGTTVLTEAASGAYAVTPVIAGLAGATVFAYARTTRYGTVQEVFDETRTLIDQLPAAVDVRLIEEITPEIVAAADVITNSGHLRPLDPARMQHARSSAVVPLMYEAWEWRDADVDLSYLRSRGIQVGATNERHPDIDVFGYLGEMAVKQVHDAGLSVYRNRFVLVCNNAFGPYIARTLSALSDGVLVIDEDRHRAAYGGLDIDWAGGFPRLEIPESYRRSAALVLATYPFDQTWIAPDGPIRTSQIAGQLEHPLVLRYVGDVDTASLADARIGFHPPEVASGHMGVLPSAIGPDSIARLQSGGLKVAELLLKGSTGFRGVPLVEVLA
jgi:hypothetical protein